MRKRVFGRKLKRNIGQRKALFRSLARELILWEKIKTTEAKAKAVRPFIERLVTIAKKKGKDGTRTLLARLPDKVVVEKLMGSIAPRFSERPGGYTRIIKLGARLKDNAPMVVMEWVEKTSLVEAQVKETKKSLEDKPRQRRSNKKPATTKTQK